MFRIIARCDIKGKNLIKGIRYEGVRVIGDPGEFAMKYYAEGADEIVYIDSVASLYERSSLAPLVENSVKDIFVPISVGGGINNLETARLILKSGAEKVIVNTAAIDNPELINILSKEFGRQAVVVSIQAKKRENYWEALTHCGRSKTGLNVSEWMVRVQELGAGEVILTSVDCDGTMNGMDLGLIRSISGIVDLPVIASGGFTNDDPIEELVREGVISGIAIGASLHKKDISIPSLKKRLHSNGINIRI
jgi:imidazoleglycerol phosphate synthase cyclase subunit